MLFDPIKNPLPLPAMCGLERSRHLFSNDEIRALSAALATGRPLLVRGEPGTGKTQLARAAAVVLNRPLVHQTVDSRTETRDLLYTFDAVARLGKAQVAGVAGLTGDEKLKAALNKRHFVRPGALWWALDWADAKAHSIGGEGPCVRSAMDDEAALNGVVVLIDEIDKADPSVPNGLLDALAHQSFMVDGVKRVQRVSPGCTPAAPSLEAQSAPLVLITTNEERTLPAAFLRRCLVLHLALPHTEDAFLTFLVERGELHHGNQTQERTTVLERAARLVWTDRVAIWDRSLSPPGLAEYLDLVAAVVRSGQSDAEQLDLLESLKAFALEKHPRELKRPQRKRTVPR